MAFISSKQQSNMSFMSMFSTAGLQSGQKSTIANIASAVTRDLSKKIEMNRFDVFQNGQPQRAALVYTNGGGSFRPLNANELREVRLFKEPAAKPAEKEKDSQETVRKEEGSAGFVVDTAVRNGDDAYNEQYETNMRQAAQIKRQMRVGKEDGSLESLAADLAVFGMDFTAMNEQNPEALIEKIQDSTLSMLDKLATGGGSVDERNRVTGASARLVNGIRSSAGAFFQVDTTNMVDVDGEQVNGDASYNVGSVVVDPLVLDLEGDGIDLTTAEEGVEFDMDGDGAKSTMSFIQGDDAFLFEDTHGDGVVHDGTQLFGNDKGHANGFEELASHDDNGDGVINRDDAIWDSLRVWVERTGDGVSSADETMSLEEAGIDSIRVGYDNVRKDDGKGNLFGQIGAYKRADGTEGLAADAWLQDLGQA